MVAGIGVFIVTRNPFWSLEAGKATLAIVGGATAGGLAGAGGTAIVQAINEKK